MLNSKLNFRLVNFALFTFIVFMLCQTSQVWGQAFTLLWKIVMPFFIAFVIAYTLYPILAFLRSKKIPKVIALFMILGLVLCFFVLIASMIFPLFFNQLISLFNSIITFIKEISLSYDLNLGPLQDSLAKSFNSILVSIGHYVSDGAINVIGISFEVVSSVIIVISSAVYFLIDMEKIRLFIRNTVRRRSKRVYVYLKQLDEEMMRYLNGFLKIVLITFFEYCVAFLIIHHPNALLLGFLAAITSLIPYFGGMITCVIAMITAFVVDPHLFYRTIVLFLCTSTLDAYVINPLVYGKTNQVHPIVVILSVFAGGILGGFLGIIIALP